MSLDAYVIGDAEDHQHAKLRAELDHWQLSKPVPRAGKVALLLLEEAHIHEIKTIWLQAWADGDPFEILEIYDDAYGYSRQAELTAWQAAIELQLKPQRHSAVVAARAERQSICITTDQFQW